MDAEEDREETDDRKIRDVVANNSLTVTMEELELVEEVAEDEEEELVEGVRDRQEEKEEVE